MNQKMDTPKINFEEERNFSDILNATFLFLKYNFKTLVASIFYYAGIFILITAILTTQFQLELMDISNLENIFSLKYFLLIISSLFTYNMIVTIVNAHIILYKNSQDTKIELNDIWILTQRNFLPNMITTILIGLAISLGIMLLIVPGVWLMGIFSIIFIMRNNEEISFNEAFHRCFDLVKNNWWNTFLVMFVSSIITSFASSLLAFPQSIISVLGIFHGTENSSIQVISLILNVVTQFGTNILSAIPIIAISLQYFSLKEHNEGTSLEKRINKINKNNENNNSSNLDY